MGFLFLFHALLYICNGQLKQKSMNISELWHKPNEEPEEGRSIIYVDDEENVWDWVGVYYKDNFDDEMGHKCWDSFVYMNEPVCWAYKDEILPSWLSNI